MLEEQNELSVYESKRFAKSLGKLTTNQLRIVEDEIDKIIDNPLIGEQKKGDLSYLRVHKFKINKQQVLLAYSWVSNKLEIYLLQFGSHENFYEKMKSQRKTDTKAIDSGFS